MNAIATADGNHANSSAEASETLSNAVTQASVDLEGGIAGEQKTLTDDALALVTDWVSTVSNAVDALYTTAFPGDTDQAAVSGAMTAFAIDSAAAWVAQASGEAAEWLTYTTDTLADWQTMADNIATAATTRVTGLVADYESMVSSIAAGIHSFTDDMANAAELWTQTVSGAAKAADVLTHGAAQTRANSTIDAAKTQADSEIGNETGAITAYNGKRKTFITNATNTALPFEKSLIGAVAGIFTSLRGLAHTQTVDDLLTIKTVFQAATTKDDAIFTKWADREFKQGVLTAAQQRDAFASTPTTNLANTPARTTTMFVPSMGITGDTTLIPLRESLVAQYLANPPTITPTASSSQAAPQQFGPPQQQNGPPPPPQVQAPKGIVKPDAAPGYWYYLTNPSAMDSDLETGFYVAGGIAALAGALAGGLAIAGIGGAAVGTGAGVGAGAGAGGAAIIATEAEAVTAFGGLSTFGRLIGMGTGPAQALARASTITLADLQAMGITLPVARWWLQFYQNAVASGKGGASAPARVIMYQRVVELLGG